MFQFLHLPLQSGSNTVLKAMRRENRAEEFIELCEAFHARFPLGGLITDIIAGFPGESDADFEATLAVLQQVVPAGVHSSRYSARPGTAAARMAPVGGAIVAKRMERLTGTTRAFSEQRHAQWVGKGERVRAAEHPREGVTLARNGAYRPVILEGKLPLGEWINVEHTAAEGFHLRAVPIAS